MIDIKSIILDDIEYYILEEVILDEKKYILLSNANDEKNIIIRRIITENNENYCEGINNDEELKKVILEFNKKING